jgi:para-nitrobenzyl esterase
MAFAGMNGRQRLRDLGVVILLMACAVAHAATGNGVVTLDSGQIRGYVFKDDRTFLGIPYAAPPVGDLRFRAPAPVTPWKGVRDAYWPGHACPQLPDPDIHLFGSTHEDCLYLNVITPNPLPAKPLPVMVWLHGGGFATGTGADYPGFKLAEQGQVIVVTLNYRLGPFGFLAHPALAAESPNDVGNYGLLDQQAALRWVSRNAAAFGGDPHNITLFGESAGGASVCANLTSPAMAGTFQKAIIESGLCALPSTLPLADAESIGQKVASDNQCPTTADAAALDCLRKLPVDALLAEEGDVSLTSAVPFYPVHGTPLLPLDAIDAINSGQFSHVPIMQGSNHDEARLIAALAFDMVSGPLTEPQYEQQIQTAYGANAASVLAQYPASAYSAPDLAYSAAFTDDQFSCDALWVDQALVAQHVPLYAYEFDDTNAPSLVSLKDVSIPLGAFHGAEVSYLFWNPLIWLTAPQQDLSKQMIAYWTQFAKTGDPNVQGNPSWPLFNAAQGNFLSLVPDSSQVTTAFAADHQCAFWQQLGI